MKLFSSRKQRVLLMVGVVVGIVALWIGQWSSHPAPQANELSARTRVGPFFPGSASSLIRVSIKSKDRVLAWQKQATGWYVCEPIEARANSCVVAGVEQRLLAWQPAQLVSAATPQASEIAADPYGFTQEGVSYTLTWMGGVTRCLILGAMDPVTGMLFAKLGDESPSIYLTEVDPVLQINQLNQMLPLKTIFPEMKSDLSKIRFFRQGSLIVLDRISSRANYQAVTPSASAPLTEQWEINYPERCLARPEVVQQIIAMVQQLEYLRISEAPMGSRMMMAEYGLSNPEAKLEFYFQSGATPQGIYFGRKRENQSLCAMTNFNSNLYELDPLRIEQLEQLFQKVNSRRLVTFLNQVGQIQIGFAQQHFTLWLEDEIWIAKATRQEADAPVSTKLLSVDAKEFDASEVIQQLEECAYSDQRDPGGVRSLRLLGKSELTVEFFHVLGKLMDTYVFYPAPGKPDTLVLVRQSDQKQYFLSREFLTRLQQVLQQKKIPRVLRDSQKTRAVREDS